MSKYDSCHLKISEPLKKVNFLLVAISHCLYDRGMTEEEDKELIELMNPQFRSIPTFLLSQHLF